MEEDKMAEFRLRIFTSPWHATLERISGERVSGNVALEDQEPQILPLPLEFFSPLELVSFLEQNNAVRRGLR
jgi:hypothetical protein